MAKIICIETSTEVCSVALCDNGKTVWQKIHAEGMAHSTKLAPFLQEMQAFMKAEGLKPDAVAVSGGPGSYTGLRIGVSTAKGLCYGYGIPLISVDTLKIMASNAVEILRNTSPNDLFCPMIDARRMEVYTAFFDADLKQTGKTSAEIITSDSFADQFSSHTVYFFGNGSQKCKSVLTSAHAEFIDGISPLASYMAKEAEKKYAGSDFKDVAYFEPAYLKEFVATISKNKVIDLPEKK